MNLTRILILGLMCSQLPLFAQNKVEQYKPNHPNRVKKQLQYQLPFKTQSELLNLEEVGGQLVFEGDILLKSPSSNPSNAENDGGTSNTEVRWAGAVIPYEIEAGHPSETDILTAINLMNEKTVLYLIPRTTQTDYVRFVTGDGCSSFIGKQGGMQPIVIGNCGVGSTMHEILHAAGMYHEQSRPDRDGYIRVNFGNIETSKVSNFQIRPNTTSNCSYDYGSIMHYPRTAFSANGLPTIEPYDNIPPGMVMGQRSALSPCDIIGVANLYNTPLFGIATHYAPAGYAIPNGKWIAGDFNGDGKQDMVHIVNNSNYVHTWFSLGNGHYNITTGAAWAGYAIPNGEWFAADHNGDGKTDLIHVVNGSNYLHTWLSNGNGTYQVTTGYAWAGYAIPNGNWIVGDYNGDGRADLVHAVAGTNYIHTWFARGNGTYQITTQYAGVGYQISNGQWFSGDYNGDGRSDLYHVVNNSNYVHTWLSSGNGNYQILIGYAWAGYAIPNGKWLVGDYNGDGRTDLAHAVAGTNKIHTWFARGDATGRFNVTTSLANWGYDVMNGQWFTGDYNGDGKSDLLHVVNNSNYVHAWLSNGVGGYWVSKSAAWAGYAIPNGAWSPINANNDRRTDLFHAVANSNWAHTWIAKPLNLLGSVRLKKDAVSLPVAATPADSKMDTSVQLFPNPTTGNITLQLTDFQPNRYKILNQTGQVLMEDVFNGNELNIAHLSNGIYQVELSNEQKLVQKRIVKH